MVLVTPTASGKTLAYNLPILQRCIDDPDASALYLFPTKALAQDQRHELDGLVREAGLGLHVATYDGDTPTSAAVRSAPVRGWSSPTPTCCTRQCCPTIRSGSGSSAACVTW